MNRRALLKAAPIEALARDYAATYAEGQRMHLAAGEDPERLAAAYAVQDRAARLAADLARTPATSAREVLLKVATLIGDRLVSYPGAEAVIRAEALALLAA